MRVKSAMERLSLAALLAIAAACIADAHEVRRSIEPLGPGLTAHPKLSIIRQAPAFVLHDTKRRPVRLEDSRRRVVLLSFIYTTCTTACPLLTERMARLRDRLQLVGDWGRRVNFLSVTVDPTRIVRNACRNMPSSLARPTTVGAFCATSRKRCGRSWLPMANGSGGLATVSWTIPPEFFSSTPAGTYGRSTLWHSSTSGRRFLTFTRCSPSHLEPRPNWSSKSSP
jgi:hypothetical protein